VIPVNATVLRAIVPRFSGAKAEAQARIIDAIDGTIQSSLAQHKIDTRLRIAHFLAQIVHESAGMRTTEEFASGEKYEGRRDLGNVRPGDGPRYKGRGLIQLTGRANYKRFGEKLRIPLEDEPARAAEPGLSLTIACEYWSDRKVNPFCDADDLIAVTRKVNGGLIGLDDRRQYLVKAKAALANVEALLVAADAPADARPVLRRGSRGDAVGELQTLLRKAGFLLAVDQDFGPATELAVMSVQKDARLTPAGIVDPPTWRAIEKRAA
jgi:putative chitinase